MCNHIINKLNNNIDQNFVDFIVSENHNNHKYLLNNNIYNKKRLT